MTVTLHISTLRHDEWRGKPRYIRIYVYDTTAELQSAAHRYRPYFNYEGVGGCYHPPDKCERYDEKTKKWVDSTRPSWGGIIRLSREYLSQEVVTHECVHAACGIYRMDCWPKIHLEDDTGMKEEFLAYIIGDLAGGLSNKLTEKGIW